MTIENRNPINPDDFITLPRVRYDELIAMARRYQILRRHVWVSGPPGFEQFQILDLQPSKTGRSDREKLDAAIDAAMQEQKL